MGRRYRKPLLGALLALAANAQAADDLLSLGLEDLMNVGVIGASKYAQPQHEIAAAVSIITRQEIRAHGWRTLGDALSSLPGFTTSYDRQYVYPSMRGLGLPGDYATRVLVTVDGIRVNDPLYDQGTFGRMLPIDLDLIERIEFIAGPGGAVYGQNAMFSVVNLVTREAANVGGLEFAVTGQQPQRLREARASWGGRGPADSEILISASGLDAGGENRFYEFGASGASGIARGLDWERDRELFARVRREAWTFEAMHGVHVKGDPAANFFTDPLVAGKAVEDRYDLAQLGYQRGVAGGALQLTARLFGGWYASDATGSSGGWRFGTRARSSFVGTEVRFVTTSLPAHTLMWGFEGQIEPHRDQLFVDLTDAAGSFGVIRDGYRAGLFVQDQWQIVPTVAATLGLRVDDAQGSRGRNWSPRAGLIWRPADVVTLKALYGRAQREPNAFERDYRDGVARVGNPDLAGERVDTAELIGDWQLPANYALRLSVYRWELADIATLGTDPVTGLAQYQPGSPVDANGIELSLDHTWAAGARLRASVSLQDADWTGIAPLANSPALLARLTHEQPLPWSALHLATSWRYDGARRTLGGRRLGGGALADVALRYDPHAQGLDLSLALTNLFDHRIEHPLADTNWQDSLDQDGRAVQVRVGYRF